MNSPSDTASLPDSHRRGNWLVGIGVVALAGIGLAALRCWFWVATIALGFGPNSRFWIQAAALAGCLALLMLVASGLRRYTGIGHQLNRWLWLILLAWSACADGIWRWYGSPFSQGPLVVSGFVLSSLWLLWGWMYWLLPVSSNRKRFATVACLVLAVGFFVAWRADGWDGNALPRLAWRFAPAANWSTQSAEERLARPQGRKDSGNLQNNEPFADYPRYRGDDGLGTVRGPKLARNWILQPPKLLWKHAVGVGWSSLAVAGTQVFTQEQRESQECVVCYDRATGSELWVHRDDAHYQAPETGGGPRATPTVDGEQVFSLGGTGLLNALHRETGQPQWQVNILQETGAHLPMHGMVSSPLVVGNNVIVCAGGKGASIVAYDRATGNRAWASGDDEAGYTSPLLLELAGDEQIVILGKRELTGYHSETGAVLWSTPFANDQLTNCSQPCPVGKNHLFASTNYGTGCALFEIARGQGETFRVESLWTNRTLQTKFCSAVVHDGHAFGLDDGILECVSIQDGRRRWKRGRYGHGQLMLVNDLLLIQAEDGRVVLVPATPKAFDELTFFTPLEGRTWNHPALAGNQLFVRNDREAACYELPMEESPLASKNASAKEPFELLDWSKAPFAPDSPLQKPVPMKRPPTP